MKEKFLIIFFLSNFIFFYEFTFGSDITTIEKKYYRKETPLSVRNMRSWGGHRSSRFAKSALQIGTGVPKEFIKSESIKNNNSLQNQYNLASSSSSSYQNNNRNNEDEFFADMSESDQEELDNLLAELLKEYDGIDD